MNRSTFVPRSSAQHLLGELQEHEREVRRPNAEISRDPIARPVIALDLRVRRLAHRVARLLAPTRDTTSAVH